MKWPLAALTLTRTSSTSVNLIALPVPTTPDTGHGAWARATCHPIHAEFARARAILKIAKDFTQAAPTVTDTGPGIPGRASDEDFRHAPVEIPIDPPAENVWRNDADCAQDGPC